jgi:catechol 2,3-dioxygenase-like lactoylglutathione lyase family enzyme
MKPRFLPLLALALLSAAAWAQTGQITGIAHVAYRVTDLDKEVAFFQKLGYQQAFTVTSPAGKVTESFIKVNDRQFIELYPQADTTQPLGWMHVCYESDDLPALVATLTAHALNPEPSRKAGAGNLISSLKDPEGRVTEFTQYMPGSRHTLDKGLHLGEHRISDEMLGFSLPVPDIEAERKFYTTGMGFAARDTKTGLRVTSTGVRIQLRPAAAGIVPETTFHLADTAKATKHLQALGLTPRQDGNRVLVTDPDGNVFAYISPRPR